MAKQKYYGTDIVLCGEVIGKLRDKFGYKIQRCNKFRIVCKAISMVEANRIARKLGLYQPFHPDYTTETINCVEIECVDKYGFIICTSGTMGNEYIDFRELIEEGE